MSTVASSSALLAAPARPGTPASDQILDVAREFGVSPFRQFREMIRLCAGFRGLAFHEYYSAGVFRPDLTGQDKLGFVGERGSYRLNCRLSPRKLSTLRPFLRDKVLYGTMMTALGFRLPHTQAVVSLERGYGDLPCLKAPGEIAHFLLETADYPLFVKPEDGSGSVGSALIVEVDRDARELLLLNGKRIAVGTFAQEVLRDYGEGFLIQSALAQHPDLSAITGDAVGTIRVVTVEDGTGAQPLYALWKIPSPSAMSDNSWQDGSMLAEIDAASGRVLQCRRGSGPRQEMLETHPASGRPIRDLRLPHWEAVIRSAIEGHKVVPRFGVLGWDIAITGDGPVIVECNANPHHMLYQLATGRAIRNAEFNPVFDRIEARAKAMITRLRHNARKEPAPA